jgi:hypothetical protein
VGNLFGGGEIGHQGVRDSEPVGDDPRHVDGGIAHPLDGGDDPEDTGHLVGVAGRPGGEDADRPHLVHERGEPFLELDHLVGHGRVGEEQRCVPQVDHQLGGVLRLREHGLEISWSIVHSGAPPGYQRAIARRMRGHP